MSLEIMDIASIGCCLYRPRFVGIKSRGVYETPGGTLLREVHMDLEGICLDKEVMEYGVGIGSSRIGSLGTSGCNLVADGGAAAMTVGDRKFAMTGFWRMHKINSHENADFRARWA